MTNVCPVCNNEIEDGANACPHCGYKLQGSTQRFVPVALDDASIANELPKRKREGIIYVVRGPQTGVEFKLGSDVLQVGRDPKCDIFLNDMTVSRKHATITPIDGGYKISDEASYNGVWVNNKNVETYTLVDGDIVQIGAFCLVYKEV